MQIVFKLVEVYSCFTEKAHNHLQQLKRSFSPLLHLQLSGPATILPLSPLSPFSRLCPLASFLLAAGQLGSGPPWLGSGVASAGQEGGGEVGRGGEGGGTEERGRRGFCPTGDPRGSPSEKNRKQTRAFTQSRRKKKRQQLCPSPLSLSLYTSPIFPLPLFLSHSFSPGRGLAGLGLNAICCIM